MFQYVTFSVQTLTRYSWTAVVQGAVIYGVEKSRHPEANYMAAVTNSYGVVVEDRFEWLVKKGDLVLSREKRSIHSRIFSIPPTKCPMGKLDIPIYSCVDKDDYAAPAFWQEGQHGMFPRYKSWSQY